MAAIRHLGIVYHHTRPPTKSLLLAAAACQISCQSDTQIWRYSYLNFSHIWLEMHSGPQNGGFGGLWTPKCDYSSSPKGISLCKSASFKLSTVKIRWGVWPVCELAESVTDTQTHTHRHTHRGKFIFCPWIALDRQKVRSRYCTVEANYGKARSIARPLCESRATCLKRYTDEHI